MQKIVRTERGLTLIELMVALLISALIIAALYRTFVGQQKTYTVQEQVVEMRQNQRAAISNMMRELRMTGFGSVSGRLPITLAGRTYEHVVNRDTPSAGWITVVGAVISDSRNPYLKSTPTQKGNSPVIEISSDDPSFVLTQVFDAGANSGKNYISIGGVETHRIVSISGSRLTLGERLLYKNKDYDHTDPDYRDPDNEKYNPNPTRVYPIRAISYYAGVRNENTGGGGQPTAENIESIQFEYLDAQGNPAAADEAVQMVRVTVRAVTDPDKPDASLVQAGGDGLRRREISSNIMLRNVIMDQ